MEPVTLRSHLTDYTWMVGQQTKQKSKKKERKKQGREYADDPCHFFPSLFVRISVYLLDFDQRVLCKVVSEEGRKKTDNANPPKFLEFEKRP